MRFIPITHVYGECVVHVVYVCIIICCYVVALRMEFLHWYSKITVQECEVFWFCKFHIFLFHIFSSRCILISITAPKICLHEISNWKSHQLSILDITMLGCCWPRTRNFLNFIHTTGKFPILNNFLPILIIRLVTKIKIFIHTRETFKQSSTSLISKINHFHT